MNIKIDTMLIKYISVSLIVLGIDVISTYCILFFLGGIFVANMLGNLIGFFVQYILCSNHVFGNPLTKAFFIMYGITFINGLLLSGSIIWYTYNALGLSFMLSKALAVIIPFCATYYLRKKWSSKLDDSRMDVIRTS